jgi:hypothetical protein
MQRNADQRAAEQKAEEEGGKTKTGSSLEYRIAYFFAKPQFKPCNEPFLECPS